MIVVALDDEGMQYKPNLRWIKAEDAGVALIDLQISKMECEKSQKDSLGSKESYDDTIDGRQDMYRDEFFDKPPGIGYHFGVYMRSDLDARALLRVIEPAADTGKPSEIVCKALRAVPENEESQGDLFPRAAIAD